MEKTKAIVINLELAEFEVALKAAVTDDTAMLSLGKCSPPDILSLSDSIRAF